MEEGSIFPWALDVLKKNVLTMLKAATNKDLDHLGAILPSKFAAKIGGEGQIMKTGLKNRGGRGKSRLRRFTRGSILLGELHLMQFGIETPFRQELLMCPDLPDLALIQNDDLVGFPDRGKPVSND